MKPEPRIVVAVRLEPDVAHALRKRAAQQQTTPSDELRAAVRNYLDLETTPA